jgi:hypothetical protein
MWISSTADALFWCASASFNTGFAELPCHLGGLELEGFPALNRQRKRTSVCLPSHRLQIGISTGEFGWRQLCAARFWTRR